MAEEEKNQRTCKTGNRGTDGQKEKMDGTITRLSVGNSHYRSSNKSYALVS